MTDNSIKACKKGDVVTLKAMSTQTGVALTATDTGCNKAEEMQTVITPQGISAPNIAQQTMAETAGNGKTYLYYWEAEDVEGSIERFKEELSAPSGSAVSYPEGLKLDDDRTINDVIEEKRKGLQWESDLNPTITAQEAANIIGTILEEQYGFDLTGETLKLTCYQSDSDMFYHIDGGAPMRTTWGCYYEIENDTWFPTSASVGIDAFTGETVSVSYILDEATRNKAFEAEMPTCIELNENGNFFNKDDASFKPTSDAVIAAITKAINESLLLGGASVDEIEWKNITEGEAKGGLWLNIKSTDLKEYTLSWIYPTPNYDFDGYPLRAFTYFNLSYLK